MTIPLAWLLCATPAFIGIVLARRLQPQTRTLVRGLVVGVFCTPIFFVWGEYFQILPLPLWLVSVIEEAAGSRRFSAGMGTFVAFLGVTLIVSTIFSIWDWERKKEQAPRDAA
jgi:hypothetical protein